LSFDCIFNALNKEPIRIPSAAMLVTDDVDDDASSLLVTKLMQTAGSTTGRQVVGCAAAAVAGVSNGVMKSTLSDSNNSVVDVSPERRNADNLHQLSLYEFVLIIAL